MSATSEKPAWASSVAASVSGSSVRSRHRPVSSSTAETLSVCCGVHGGTDDAAVLAERRGYDGECGRRRVLEQRPERGLDPLPERTLRAEPASEHDYRRIEGVREHGEYLPELGGSSVDESCVLRVGYDIFRPLRAGRERKRTPARHALDRRGAERDRLTARA